MSEDDLCRIRAQLEKNFPGQHIMILGFYPIAPSLTAPYKPTEYIVKNLTKRTDHHFTDQQEAERFYAGLERGNRYELELFAKIRSCKPSVC